MLRCENSASAVEEQQREPHFTAQRIKHFEPANDEFLACLGTAVEIKGIIPLAVAAFIVIDHRQGMAGADKVLRSYLIDGTIRTAAAPTLRTGRLGFIEAGTKFERRIRPEVSWCDITV